MTWIYKKNNNIKRGIATLVAILFCFSVKSQSDSTLIHYSFGFDASKVFNQLFRANVYSSILYLEYRFNETSTFRLAGDIGNISGEEGKIDRQIKLGYKYNFRSTKKWQFYSGLDFLYGYEYNKNSKVELFREGGLFYIGATVFLHKHFSLTTEPSFYLVFEQSHDLDSFNKSWSNINFQGFTNIGLVRVTYHF